MSQNQQQRSTQPVTDTEWQSAVIRFCGDSGDGMQLTGMQFTNTTAIAGNDLMTFPDFPAEIRAPQGTLAGVSGFQIQFSDHQIFTPGDDVDVLVAMNPAALKTNLDSLKTGGILIVNKDAFIERNWIKAGYEKNPLDKTEILNRYQFISAPITSLTLNALEELDLPKNVAERAKNFFALGITYWLFHRDLKPSLEWIKNKFKKSPELVEANHKALKTGYNYADTTELIAHRYSIANASLPTGTYRNINGANALAIGLTTAAQLAKLPLTYTGYPITPASDILHHMNHYRHMGVQTYQAEDEIAAVGAAIGASFGGNIAVTASSGPGIALKMEAIGLAVMTELPLVVINAQRGGPSTGLPTKTEQSDLLQCLYGRNGESPVAIISSSQPSDGFDCAIEAVRMALYAMCPVFLMTDGYLIMGSEPWLLPEPDSLEPIRHHQNVSDLNNQNYQPYQREPESLARRWVIPGKAGLEHRIGGIEKDHLSGNVSYNPDNHEKMVWTRAEKIKGLQSIIPDQEIYGRPQGRLLVLGWGSTFGAIRQAVRGCQREGLSVSHAHLRYLNPFPKNLISILSNFERILIPELNTGQLAVLIRQSYQGQVFQQNKIKGRPFLIGELSQKIHELANA